MIFLNHTKLQLFYQSVCIYAKRSSTHTKLDAGHSNTSCLPSVAYCFHPRLSHYWVSVARLQVCKLFGQSLESTKESTVVTIINFILLEVFEQETLNFWITKYSRTVTLVPGGVVTLRKGIRWYSIPNTVCVPSVNSSSNILLDFIFGSEG